ncbi:MAG TPA: hypothetical protein VG408_01880 [Actinomycetota bacterium]|nr:hypothetical protein [Actinomycetota bacterium]
MKLVRNLLLAGVLLTVAAGQAFAQAEFSPEMSFTLSDTKVSANPSLEIHVEQEDNEEEMDAVTLTIPKGFTLPADEAIDGGTQIGSGTINLHVGPGCHPSNPTGQGDVGVDIPATLEEVDRTDEQVDEGVVAVWLLEIAHLDIPLEVTGSTTAGWAILGNIPTSDPSCPPLVLDLTIVDKVGDVPILVNPKKAGKKMFSATFTSQNSPATATVTQIITITK